jgi:hypothetical protein
MRTETITRTIYTFEELTPEAQQNAINQYRGDGIDTSHNWDEARHSVNAFCDLFDCRTGRNSWLDVTANDCETRHDLTGQRLRTYLLNNFSSAFYERKYRGHSKNDHRSTERPKDHRMVTKIRKDHKGNYYRVFRSNFEVESCCPFTGVCYDEDLLQPLKEFIKQPDARTFDDLMTEAGESLRISLESEDEYRNSDEAVKETIEANAYEFTEDGELI